MSRKSKAGPPTFREMARALGWEETPADGDSGCDCIYCATGIGGWCSSRPMPIDLPLGGVGTRITFRLLDSIACH